MSKGLRSALVGVLATVAVTAWSGGVHALQIVQTTGYIEAGASSETFVNAAATRSAALFDPGLGTLDSVGFNFDGYVIYSMSALFYSRDGDPGVPIEGSVSLTNIVSEFSVPGYGTWSQSLGNRGRACDDVGEYCFVGDGSMIPFTIIAPDLTGDMLANYVGRGWFDIDFALRATPEYSAATAEINTPDASLNWGGTFKVTYTYTPAPEPTTLALFGVGVGVVGLAGAIRRRRPR